MRPKAGGRYLIYISPFGFLPTTSTAVFMIFLSRSRVASHLANANGWNKSPMTRKTGSRGGWRIACDKNGQAHRTPCAKNFSTPAEFGIMPFINLCLAIESQEIIPNYNEHCAN
jgi:hypothetical protein